MSVKSVSCVLVLLAQLIISAVLYQSLCTCRCCRLHQHCRRQMLTFVPTPTSHHPHTCTLHPTTNPNLPTHHLYPYPPYPNTPTYPNYTTHSTHTHPHPCTLLPYTHNPPTLLPYPSLQNMGGVVVGVEVRMVGYMVGSGLWFLIHLHPEVNVTVPIYKRLTIPSLTD